MSRAPKSKGVQAPPAPPPEREGTRTRAVKEPRRRRRNTGEFEERIGHHFKDPALLEQALTHVSALARVRQLGGSSYQRLEFLGDHVLGLIVSDMLFRNFPRADEGELSRRLADLVRKEACADVARTIGLGEAIRLGASESNAGGRDRTAILGRAQGPGPQPGIPHHRRAAWPVASGGGRTLEARRRAGGCRRHAVAGRDQAGPPRWLSPLPLCRMLVPPI